MALKENSKRILDIMVSKPNLNQTQAYKEVHPTASDNTARNNASQLLKKPEAQLYLQKHIDKARTRIVELVGSEKEEIALRASDSVLDRALGKPIQRQEVQSTSVTLNLNLSDIVE